MKVRTSIDDGIATITIDRPEVRNAIDSETIAGIQAGFEDAAAGGAQAAVFTGAGNAFRSGADLGYVRAAFERGAESVLAPLVDDLHALIRRMRELPFPIIGAVEGPAAGAGMGLALATDVRVAGKSAVFVAAYLAIGASPDGGVSYALTRSLGAARATELLLSNRPVRAEELLSLGLVEQVVEEGAALEAAQDRAWQLRNLPPLALLRTRALVDAASTQSLDSHLDAEREGIVGLWPTHDFREGIGAFLERRPPRFEGR